MGTVQGILFILILSFALAEETSGTCFATPKCIPGLHSMIVHLLSCLLWFACRNVYSACTVYKLRTIRGRLKATCRQVRAVLLWVGVSGDSNRGMLGCVSFCVCLRGYIPVQKFRGKILFAVIKGEPENRCSCMLLC